MNGLQLPNAELVPRVANGEPGSNLGEALQVFLQGSPVNFINAAVVFPGE